MSDENNRNSIGDPEPVEHSGGSNFIITLAAYVALVCGGFFAFGNLVVPTRVRGSTGSSRLKWHQQQVEAQHAVAAEEAGTVDASPAP